MKFSNVIFDFDGTLVDSSGDILASLTGAMRKVGIKPVRPVDKTVVGPPVAEMLAKLAPDMTPLQAAEAVAAFRSSYDRSAYSSTVFYPGIRETLLVFKAAGVGLFIATNKPECPTKRVLQAVDGDFFDGIMCVDSLPGIKLSKTAMLEKIILDWRLDKKSTLMVGDCDSDICAAKEAGLKGAAVLWGYGAHSVCDCGPDFKISSSAELSALVM